LLYYVSLVIGPNQKIHIILGHAGLNYTRELLLTPHVWIETLMM